jgi:phosphoribosylaminoimidazolecarboxamide formyltransferase/IMP cyclohydrolase
VTVVVDPADYTVVAEELQTRGETTSELRARLAAKVFQTTGYYDSLIANYLLKQNPEGETFPEIQAVPMRKAQKARYGENPHQAAAIYGDFFKHFTQLHGKELSYNNFIDINAAVQLIREFTEQPSVAILKHNNPCGVGAGSTLLEAWNNAYATDRQAPFGGIIVVNRSLDLPIAEAISEIFSEVIIAPSFQPDALALLQKKKNLRLMLDLGTAAVAGSARTEMRSMIGHSFLVQESDVRLATRAECKVVTQRQPTPEEWDALLFGWRVVKHVKSNAIVYAKAGRTIGIGAGQMARVDSSKVAVWKAGEAGLDLKGSVVSSDAFFPFPDGLIAAAEAGATAAIQPGGSVRDAEVIEAADARGVAMVFTGMRHFRH